MILIVVDFPPEAGGYSDVDSEGALMFEKGFAGLAAQ